MKRSDLGVILFFYCICVVFYVLIQDLPDEAQTYPTTILAVLGFLNTLFLAKQIKQLPALGVINDLPEVFSGFQGKQFLIIAIFALGYIVLLPITGFYITSLLFMIVCMLFLRVPKVHLALSILVMAVLIYVVFTLFLKVPLPLGSLFN